MSQRRLDGWKAIAVHMNRSVRQCQRLAESSGLPVHKLPGSRAVFAYQEEIDAWIAGDETPRPADVEARITNSGGHVILPVELAGTTPAVPETDQDSMAGDVAAAPRGRLTARRVTIAATVLLGALVLLAAGLHFNSTSGWRNRGTPLTSSWTFAGGGVDGASQSIGRYDTGYFFGPGASATVNLRSAGTRWSGGLEIFEDDLHWTFVSLSPRQHEVDVHRFPAGTVNALFAGSDLSPGATIRLTVTVIGNMLKIACGSCREASVTLHRGDVSSGRLLLRVGSAGDEIHEPSGGQCRFTDLEVRGSPAAMPLNLAQEVPPAKRPTAVYTLTVDNVDDQIDVLIDGRRLASAGYREKIGPLDINPYLTRGEHTITALLFNRKWTAAYGIRLAENGVELWNESCGDVKKIHSGCEETMRRLGMVKRLSFSFTAK